MKEKIMILLVAGVAFGASAENEVLTGPDLWGQRAAHPAVVNPVLGADAANVISLRGDWEFTTEARNLPVRNGIWGRMFEQEWKSVRRISVPGCWEAQGVGEPADGECWDPVWDNNAKPIRHKYMGEGWYRKNVVIPAAWQGKRIWIKFGGVKSVGWVFVNERQVALVDTSCGTVKYEITDLVKPGETARIVVDVDNRKPSRKGLMSAMHKWGGIYRDVELEATPQTFIDDAWFRGNFDRQEAELHVEMATASHAEANLKIRVTVEDQIIEQAISQSPNPTISQSHNLNNQTIVTIPLRNFRPWSPEHPNLYTGVVELVENGQVVQTRRERFGIRKLEVRGKEFYLNNKPYYFRGFGDDHIYPLTGLTPADVNEHRRHLAKARAAGFNFVRLHTHTEVPEYFEAADELGIMIQAELPYYSDVPTESFAFDPVRDVTDLWKNYRRHPSFAVYSMGNEGSFGPDLDRALHAYVKKMDPDRFKINQDCHVQKINPPDCSDYFGGPIKMWNRGTYDPPGPFVTHEYMNLGAKLDSRLEPKFAGVWQPPVTRAKRAEWLARFGLDNTWGDRLQDASHALQRVYQKRGIECARTDPHCDGHCFWTIVDVVVENKGTYSAQGMFNPFWEQKPNGYSPEDVAVFNSASGVFLDTDPVDRIFTSGQSFKADVLFAHYGDAPLKNAQVKWSIVADGKTLAEGALPAGALALGGVRKIASTTLVAPKVERPCRAIVKLEVLSAAEAKPVTCNFWDCWLFPTRAKRDGHTIAVAKAFMPKLVGRFEGLLPEERAAEAQVVVAEYDSKLAADALARGQRVVTIQGAEGPSNVSLGWWWMGQQVGTALRKHPALGALPHEGALSPLLFRVVKPGKQLPVAGLAQDDMIVVGEGGDACYLYLAQAKCDKGRLLMSFGLDVLSDTPEGTAILDGLIDWARSDKFAPTSEVKLERADTADAIRAWEAETGGLPRDPNEKVVDAPKDMKLVLLLGQSNMAGRAKIPEADRQPLARAYKLNRDDQWVAATAPFHYDRATAGMSPANEFVKRYLAEHPNETVGIVPCAVGGSRLATWFVDGKGLSGANYRRALARAKVAAQKGTFVAILWHQGETDAGRKEATEASIAAYYPKKFGEMVEAFRRELGVPDLPVVIGEIGRFMPNEAPKVNPVLRRLPQTVRNCACASSEGLKNQDAYHFDTASAAELGRRYYDAFRRLTGPRSFYDAKLVVQLDFEDVTVENRAQRLADIRAAGADALEIAVCEFFPDGEKRVRELAKLKDMIAYFENAGLPVAVWTSSLGYGESTNKDLLRRFPNRRKLTSFEGQRAVVCSTDDAYVAALAENARDFVRAGAKFILWDDDLVQSCRPGISCVCEEHLARYAKRVGHPVTAADVKASFTGAPNPLRTAFLDVMGETLQSCCTRLRAAADEVDPTVGMGICASYTHYDLDGVDMEKLVRSLMGKGQPRPFLRVSGAPYWAKPSWKPIWRKMPGMDLGSVMEFVRTQTARYRGSDILLTDENDPYPRRSEQVPAGMTEAYDKVIIAEGGCVRNKYILRYGRDRVDTSYLDLHLKNMSGDAELAERFRDAKPFGFRVYFPEHLLRTANLPQQYIGDPDLKAFASFPAAGIFLAQNGVPTQYEREDGPGAAFGPAATTVPASAFRRGLLIDLVAARELTAKGVDVGIASDGADGVRLNPAARVLAWCERNGKKVPEWWLYENAQGGRFAVLGYEQWDVLYGEGQPSDRKERGTKPGERAWNPVAVRNPPLDAIWRFFTESPLPFQVVGAAGVYPLVKERADGSLAVLLGNMRNAPSGPFLVRAGEKASVHELPAWGFKVLP